MRDTTPVDHHALIAQLQRALAEFHVGGCRSQETNWRDCTCGLNDGIAKAAQQRINRLELERDELRSALRTIREYLGDINLPLNVRVDDAYCVVLDAIGAEWA